MKNKVLVIAAHADDEVLGCGGVISKLVNEGSEVTVMFMTNGVGSREHNGSVNPSNARVMHSQKAADILGISRIFQLDFPDNALDTMPLLTIVKAIEKAIKDLKPSIVFTHYLHDLNIDHTVVARATLTATRPMLNCSVKQLFGYEVNSSTEWSYGSPQFTPNYFVNISTSFNFKCQAIRAYEDELRIPPHPRSIEGITALASLRGNAVGYKFAEAFQIYRMMED